MFFVLRYVDADYICSSPHRQVSRYSGSLVAHAWIPSERTEGVSACGKTNEDTHGQKEQKAERDE